MGDCNYNCRYDDHEPTPVLFIKTYSSKVSEENEKFRFRILKTVNLVNLLASGLSKLKFWFSDLNLIQTSVLQFKRWSLDDKEGIKWIKFLVFYVFTRFSVTQFKSGTISFLASQSYFVFVKLSSSGHCTVSVRGVKSTIILSS